MTFCELVCGFTAVQTNTTLTSLNLWSNDIGDAGVTALATALQTNTTLTSLDLKRNRIGDAAAVALLSARLTCTVHLDRNHFDDAQDCCTQMSQAGASWDLSRKILSARDVDWLVVALCDPRVCCFAHIDICTGRHDPCSMFADRNFCVTLCELVCGLTAVQTNTTLTSLILERNRIGDAAAIALLSAHLSCTVHLDQNHFDDAQDCCTQILQAGASWDLSRKHLSARDVDWLAVALGDPLV